MIPENCRFHPLPDRSCRNATRKCAKGFPVNSASNILRVQGAEKQVSSNETSSGNISGVAGRICRSTIVLPPYERVTHPTVSDLEPIALLSFAQPDVAASPPAKAPDRSYWISASARWTYRGATTSPATSPLKPTHPNTSHGNGRRCEERCRSNRHDAGL